MRKVSLCLGLWIAIGGLALAQSDKIVVKKGDKFMYNVRTEMEFSEMAGEEETVVRAESGGSAELHAQKISGKRIEWVYDSPDVRLKRSRNTVNEETGTDTTVSGREEKFTTDNRGNLMNGARSGRSISITGLAESIHRNTIKQWFLPKIFRKMKPGDTWEEPYNETVAIKELGLNVRTQYMVRYTFDGIVDTLGTKALRIRSATSSMKIDGNRMVEGTTVPVEGDGDHFGTAYYSTIDGLLLTSNSMNQLDMRMTQKNRDADDTVIPMTWRIKSEAIRQ